MTLRRDYEPARSGRDWLSRLVATLLAASVVLLAAIQVGDLRDGAVFAVGIGLALLLLWLAAKALIGGVRRWFPSRLPYLWRQGLANLYRPANQTVTVVLALGFGAFLLATLYLVQDTCSANSAPAARVSVPISCSSIFSPRSATVSPRSSAREDSRDRRWSPSSPCVSRR